MNKIKIGVQVTAKVCPTKVTVSGTFQGYRLEDQEDPTSVCGKVFYVKDGMQHLDYVYVDSIKVCENKNETTIKGLEDFLWCIANGGMNDRGTMPSAKKCQEWLAYLERMKEQQPGKWSEEDEHCIHQLILFCENCMQQDSEAIRCSTWLKSIRPQPDWKPSEEQMWALDVALENFYNQNDRAALESLRTDLQKLLSL